MLQLQRSRGNFFAVMRPRLKRLNPVKYLNRQEFGKDLLYAPIDVNPVGGGGGVAGKGWGLMPETIPLSSF